MSHGSTPPPARLRPEPAQSGNRRWLTVRISHLHLPALDPPKSKDAPLLQVEYADADAVFALSFLSTPPKRAAPITYPTHRLLSSSAQEGTTPSLRSTESARTPSAKPDPAPNRPPRPQPLLN